MHHSCSMGGFPQKPLLSLSEPLQGTMTENPHLQFTGPKPALFREGEGRDGTGQGGGGGRGEGSAMTSGLDIALGRNTPCSSCGDRTPHSTHPHLGMCEI